MLGTIYFKDGHTEEVTYYKLCDDNHALLFDSCSGRYYYEAGFEYLEALGAKVPYHSFFHNCPGTDHWILAFDIEKVEIKIEETNPSLE